MQAKIYISTDSSAAKETEKKYGYVLEFAGKDGIQTREGFGNIQGSYHAAMLTALIKALERFTKPCDIDIMCEDAYINNMMMRNLDTWRENGYRGARGDLIKNSDLWEKVGELTDRHNYTTKAGEHAYSGWLRNEMKRR